MSPAPTPRPPHPPRASTGARLSGPSRISVARPLDPFTSLKVKLGILVGSSVVVASTLVWFGVNYAVGPRWTLPGAVALALVVTQLLARGMTSPLREMTAAAQAMAQGDYSRRVTATSNDEVGQLAEAFNRMAEDLASVDQHRRELVANVSHELRTPVTALHAQLENMVDGVTQPDPHTLEIALQQTARLGRLVTQLLDLSRLEAGVVPFDAQDVEVRPFLVEAVKSATLVAEGSARAVEWSLEVEPTDLVVKADAGRLHQVVANLLDNASRHSPPGGRIQVAANLAGGRNPLVNIDVIDEGPGIPVEVRQQVFERFHRGAEGHTATGGTGLGLAIARWAVELHGGRIEVMDIPSGCHIRVQLPGGRADSRTSKLASTTGKLVALSRLNRPTTPPSP